MRYPAILLILATLQGCMSLHGHDDRTPSCGMGHSGQAHPSHMNTPAQNTQQESP